MEFILLLPYIGTFCAYVALFVALVLLIANGITGIAAVGRYITGAANTYQISPSWTYLIAACIVYIFFIFPVLV